jgi:SAM-dependent methyltransferase
LILDPLVRTIEAYDRIAPQYTKVWFDDPVMEPTIDRFLKYIGPNGSIIDAGCGNGRDVLAMQQRGFDVVGIDLSRAMLLEARKKVPNACFRLMDIRQIGFPPRTFDGVWACAVMQHFPSNQLEYIIKQFFKVLRFNGILALSLLAACRVT